MNYHFIAIGGAAMHNLAIALKLAGHQVSGSDDEIFEPSKSRLGNYGLLPEKFGWFPERIHSGLDAVILGMHARGENPELSRANELGIPVHSFPSFLYTHAKNKQRIVIGGSHGKTTITSMIIHALDSAGLSFDFMVGAKIEGFDVMVRLSEDAPFMLFEGDEYLTSAEDPRPKFHVYRPDMAVLSGIAWDHMNVFPSWENYVDQFRQFIALLPDGAKLFFASDDPTLSELAGEFPHLEIQAYSKISHRFGDDHSIILGSGPVDYPVPFFGSHNLMNAEAARLVCREMGLTDEQFYQSMRTFKGAGNRLETIHSSPDLKVYRDFAHAPSKVKATVKAIKERHPGQKSLACLELHTYSSLSREFIPQYAGALNDTDIAIVMLDPHVFELKKLPLISPDEVRVAFGRSDIIVVEDGRALESVLQQFYTAGQIWLMMSSGNFGAANIASIAQRLGS
jgi:UDP-N-acetylmuramate: L-alanyl-gamma-D-glutamyl-meso-diaminopimelate ligase